MSTAPIHVASRPSLGAVAVRLRETAIVVLACGVAGALVGGFGSRLVMRLAALAAPEARGMMTEAGNVVGEITLAGSVGLMLFAGLGSAVFGAGAYVVARPWLPNGTVSSGLMLGAFLLLLTGTIVIDPANADFVLLGDRLLNVATFSALFLCFGLVASTSAAFLDARLAPTGVPSTKSWLVMSLCALPAVPGILGVAFGFAPELGIPLVASSLAMSVSTSVDRRDRHGTATLLRAAATAVMLAVVVIAGAEYVDAVSTIL